ncbi:hypothetical protein [Flagellimonas marinaquae]|uniref:hypothetical protein n=1 Tax=Flagellimonas marinaquae TaxID=254955 RepID=UPI002075BB01|nr:hypothetical protein [Allomuricauda aquimarina]USD24569.1 hypothetical protein MJO53_12895 [Allomuricauda aquimarina]
MKIYGKYKNNSEIGDFPECSFLLEHGRIYNVNVDLPPIFAFSYPPKNKSDFEFEKLPSEKGLAPIGSNYLVEYIGSTDSIQRIYLKLNPFQVFRIKWQLKKYLIQDKALKLSLIGAILGVIGTLATQKLSEYFKEKNNSGTIEIQKSTEQNKTLIESKMDSTRYNKAILSDSLN